MQFALCFLFYFIIVFYYFFIFILFYFYFFKFFIVFYYFLIFYCFLLLYYCFLFFYFTLIYSIVAHTKYIISHLLPPSVIYTHTDTHILYDFCLLYLSCSFLMDSWKCYQSFQILSIWHLWSIPLICIAS